MDQPPNRLGDILWKRGITMWDLQRGTQISERAIYYWLEGRRISSAYLERIAAFLGVEPGEIQPGPVVDRPLYGTVGRGQPMRAKAPVES